jgi:HEAT repeat protein
MSGEDYAAMSNEQLMERFASAAKRFGGGRGLQEIYDRVRASAHPKGPFPKPGPSDDTTQFQAAGAELRARRATAEMRRLLEEDDPDVRSCAAMQFGTFVPELASAAMDAVLARLSTREVLAMRRSARQEPPALPSLNEMSVKALVERFEDDATREYATQFLDCLGNPNDMETRNRIVGEILHIIRELKSRNALDRLLPLLRNTNITVRREAATACLRIAEGQAVAALEEVVKTGRFDDRFAASEALTHWQKDGFAIYGV